MSEHTRILVRKEMESEFSTEDIRLICAGLLCYRDRMLEAVKNLQLLTQDGMPHTSVSSRSRESQLLKDATLAQDLCRRIWREGGLDHEDSGEEGKDEEEGE